MSYNTLRSQMLFLSLPTFCTSGTFLRLERSKDLNWQSGINKFHLFNWKHMDLYGSLAPQGVGKNHPNRSKSLPPITSPNKRCHPHPAPRVQHRSRFSQNGPAMLTEVRASGVFFCKGFPAFPTPMTPITPAFTYFAQKKQSHKNGFVYSLHLSFA